MGETNPFQKLKQDELITELDHHEIWVDNEKKADLMEKLSTKLNGICRPAALMCDDPTKSANDISIQDYKVLFCEP